MSKKKVLTAYILNSYEEFEIIKFKIKLNSTIYIFNNYLNTSKIKKKNFKDFYCNDEAYKKYNFVKDYFCKNWFKNNFEDNKSDKLNLIGSMMQSRLHSDFTDKLRIFLSLEKILKLNDKIFFSSKLPKSFKNVSKNFNNCSEFNSSKILPKFLYSIIQRSNYRYSPKIHKLSNLARVIQLLVPKNKIYNKTMVFPDPYYDKYLKKRKDMIFLNNLNPLVAYYFNNKVKKNQFFKQNDLSKKIIKKNLILLVNNKKLTINKKIIDIFCNSIIENFNNGLKYFNWSYDHYFEILKEYKPKKIIFPNIISFDYLLVNYLCKANMIESFVCLDGIEAVYNPLNIIFDNSKFIYDKLVCYGEADYKLNLAHKIKKNQLMLSKLPIHNKYSSNKIKDFEFMIMAYQPRTNNLESRWDKRYLNSIEIIKLLNSLGHKNIAVKIKQDNQNLDPEIKFLKKLINNYNCSCKILTGNIANYIGKTKNIVGGVSTIIWESSFINIPYYIYEPTNMGLLNEQINKSILFREKDVCRNLFKLKKNLINKNYFKPNKKIMFNGRSLEKLKF